MTEIELLTAINDKLNQLLTMSDFVNASSSSILVYTTVYIPLFVISISLFWFFKQFMERYL